MTFREPCVFEFVKLTARKLLAKSVLIFYGDAQQTPGGIARTAPNAKRSRQQLLLEDTSNQELRKARDILQRGRPTLGNVWTKDLMDAASVDFHVVNEILPGVLDSPSTASQFEASTLSSLVDPTLLIGKSVDYSRPLIRLAWLLQHADTILP